jgi:hypothetical protein
MQCQDTCTASYKTSHKEIVQGHVLAWVYMRELMLTVDLDRIKIRIMKIDAKVCFQEGHLAAIFEIRSGRNLVEMKTAPRYILPHKVRMF